VLAHALGEGEGVLAHLLLLLGARRFELAHGLLDDRAALLVGRLEGLDVGVARRSAPGAASGTAHDHHPAVLGLRIGHVDALAPHALGVGEHGVLELGRLARAVATPAAVVVGRGGGLAAEGGDVVRAAAPAPAARPEEGGDGDGGEQRGERSCGSHGEHHGGPSLGGC
jgi:hypothetical protein